MNLGLLYFDEPDESGHKFGPDSPEVIEAIQKVDAALGYLIKRLNESNLLRSTDIIMTADHGMISANKGLVNIDTCIDSKWYTSNHDHETVLFIYPQKGDFINSDICWIDWLKNFLILLLIHPPPPHPHPPPKKKEVYCDVTPCYKVCNL